MLDGRVFVVVEGRLRRVEAAAAEHAQRAALAALPEAHVERHLGVVDVQRQVAVALGRVLHGEAVMVVEGVASHVREATPSEGRGLAREHVVERRGAPKGRAGAV